MEYPKRLIEVDLPIKRISEHARREKSIRQGHISTLHIWWARRPLAACRAVACASLWPDPLDPLCPKKFREQAANIITEFAKKAVSNRNIVDNFSPEAWRTWNKLSRAENKLDIKQETHLSLLRYALFDFIADFANWDNSIVKEYLETSQALTKAAHEALSGTLNTKPLVVDPFAGGGSIPLEALRVGADAFASDLNPIPVLLNKVLLEYVPTYGQRLADELRKWGKWIQIEAEKELAEFYYKDPDGSTPLAYLWARTIQCEGPKCGAEVPLLRSLWLAKNSSCPVALQLLPKPKAKRVDFKIILKQHGVWVDSEDTKIKIGSPTFEGTVKRGSATCPCCGYTTPVARVREQLCKRSGGSNDARLYAVVTARQEEQGRFYRSPSDKDTIIANKAISELQRREKDHRGKLSLVPNESTTHYESFVNRGPIYGMEKWKDFFTPRQALALSTFSTLVNTVKMKVQSDKSFTDALTTILALGVGRCTNQFCTLSKWNAGRELVDGVFARQALPMLWDFGEINPFGRSNGFWMGAIEWMAAVLERCAGTAVGHAEQESAVQHSLPDDCADSIFTDPPYYYSVQYADLSDFFYVWLRRIIGEIHPTLFKSELTNKTEEIIVQSPGHQFATSGKNTDFYLRNMQQAMVESRRIMKPEGIGIVVFAHSSTAAWEAQIQAMINAGWIITGSWPIDTELASRVISQGRAVLASSIHLVCRPRENPDGSVITTEIGDWRDVLTELPQRIHNWMPRLAEEGVVGADAIFACLGPALEVFSRYSSVEKASGEQVTLKEYLEQVWAVVAKEALNMIFEGADTAGFEEDARLTAMWLWTLSTGAVNGDTSNDDDDDEEEKSSKTNLSGYALEYDAARKIAQGLGAHLEQLQSLVEVKGDKARLLPVSERTKALFGKDESESPTASRKKKSSQMELGFMEEVKKAEQEGSWGQKNVPHLGNTRLDRLHQAMILFAANRSEALKRFLVEEGVGRDQKFWTLAQALSALYPSTSDEKRWVDGVLARKKGLGF